MKLSATAWIEVVSFSGGDFSSIAYNCAQVWVESLIHIVSKYPSLWGFELLDSFGA